MRPEAQDNHTPNIQATSTQPLSIIEPTETSNFVELKIKPISPLDDIIFMSYASDLKESGDLAHHIYSTGLNGNIPTCLTCDLVFNEPNLSTIFFLPLDLSLDKHKLAGCGGIGSTGYFKSLHSGIWLIELNQGKVHVKETYNCFDVAWSPDGNQIAYCTGGSIEIIDTRNGEIILDTNKSDILDDVPSAHVDGYFVWSQDGKYLLYDSDGDYIVSVNINENKAVVLLPVDSEEEKFPYDSYFFAQWSPDGRQILFISDRAQLSTGYLWKDLFVDIFETGGYGEAESEDLYVIGNEESGLSCLTCGYPVPPPFVMHPMWSPDGKQIAFFSEDLSELPQNYENLFIIDSDGSILRSIARFPSEGLRMIYKRIGGSPGWSKDGKRLIFSAIHEGRWAIFVINSDGSNMHLVAFDPNQDFVHPDWLH